MNNLNSLSSLAETLFSFLFKDYVFGFLPLVDSSQPRLDSKVIQLVCTGNMHHLKFNINLLFKAFLLFQF